MWPHRKSVTVAIHLSMWPHRKSVTVAIHFTVHVATQEVSDCSNSLVHVATQEVSDCSNSLIHVATQEVSDCSNSLIHVATQEVSDCSNSLVHVATQEVSDCSNLLIHVATQEVSDCSNSLIHVATQEVSDCSNSLIHVAIQEVSVVGREATLSVYTEGEDFSWHLEIWRETIQTLANITTHTSCPVAVKKAELVFSIRFLFAPGFQCRQGWLSRRLNSWFPEQSSHTWFNFRSVKWKTNKLWRSMSTQSWLIAVFTGCRKHSRRHTD